MHDSNVNRSHLKSHFLLLSQRNWNGFRLREAPFRQLFGSLKIDIGLLHLFFKQAEGMFRLLKLLFELLFGESGPGAQPCLGLRGQVHAFARGL